MFTFLAEFKLRIIIGLIIAAVIGSAGLYINYLNGKVDKLNKSITIMKISLEEQKQTINVIRADSGKIQSANTQIITQLQNQAKQYKELNNKFTKKANGDTRSFNNIVARKPTLIQKIINNSSADAMRCLEIASGSALTEKEKNARSINEINNECPDLANPNFHAGN